MIQEIKAARIEKQLQELRMFTDTAAGVTRLPFSPAAKQAVEYLAGCMREAGLDVYTDGTGAVHGIRKGQDARRIVIGSHYDSVPEGGAFDGIAGVVCGIEIARALQALDLHYGLEIVAFNDEEGIRFGEGFLSSKALLGELTARDLKERYDSKGTSIYAAAEQAGFAPARLSEDRWEVSGLRAYFEIHVEQGGVLEHAQKKIGLVQGIVGMRRYRIVLTGQADHAGTTPMALRHDALLPAAAVISGASAAANQHPGAVATVGSLQVFPDAVNTVAGKVILSLDLRSMKEGELDDMEQKILRDLERSAAASGVAYEWTPALESPPGHMDAELLHYLQQTAAGLQAEMLPMNSGAGHDALPISAKVPAAMLFVPSRNGRSHCPEEWSDSKDLAAAAEILGNTIVRMNQEEEK